MKKLISVRLDDILLEKIDKICSDWNKEALYRQTLLRKYYRADKGYLSRSEVIELALDYCFKNNEEFIRRQKINIVSYEKVMINYFKNKINKLIDEIDSYLTKLQLNNETKSDEYGELSIILFGLINLCK